MSVESSHSKRPKVRIVDFSTEEHIRSSGLRVLDKRTFIILELCVRFVITMCYEGAPKFLSG